MVRHADASRIGCFSASGLEKTAGFVLAWRPQMLGGREDGVSARSDADHLAIDGDTQNIYDKRSIESQTPGPWTGKGVRK